MTTTQQAYDSPLHTLTRAIAPLLDNGPWVYGQPSNTEDVSHMEEQSTLCHASGKKIRLYLGEHVSKGRIEVCGKAPARKHSHANVWDLLSGNDQKAVRANTITVSAARAPEAIAKDINRRFLLEYCRLWDVMACAVREDFARLTRRQIALDRVESAFGGLATRTAANPRQKGIIPDSDLLHFNTDNVFGDIRCSTYEPFSFNLEIRCCDLVLIKALAKTIAKHEKGDRS